MPAPGRYEFTIGHRLAVVVQIRVNGRNEYRASQDLVGADRERAAGWLAKLLSVPHETAYALLFPFG